MLVYRSQQQIASPSQLLAGFRDRLKRCESIGPADHGRVVELLVDFQELEVGVADALCPEQDLDCRLMRRFRRAGLSLAHIFYLSWKGVADRIGGWSAR